MTIGLEEQVGVLGLVQIQRKRGKTLDLFTRNTPDTLRGLAHQNASKILGRPSEMKKITWIKVAENLHPKLISAYQGVTCIPTSKITSSGTSFANRSSIPNFPRTFLNSSGIRFNFLVLGSADWFSSFVESFSDRVFFEPFRVLFLDTLPLNSSSSDSSWSSSREPSRWGWSVLDSLTVVVSSWVWATTFFSWIRADRRAIDRLSWWGREKSEGHAILVQ